ncbi:fatty acid desaturase family protein [Argonema antarcticum]|uniref:fatty acid desaturase family protein n=1 Tax=Argonema antarcticum TaxID=2942763 RepID=UPI002011584A|nr:fatty acid desaturase [Argonema antarcticum]MCL1475051.1 fatty acid desaturase [Argonema antarcticum A004/B2]
MINSEMSLQNLINRVHEEAMIPQNVYAKTLRPLLPAEAFAPDSSKLVILLINLIILILGWTIASGLDRWPVYLLWLYLPFAIIMGNSVIVLLFSSHDLMHGSAIRNVRAMRIISLLGLTLLWMPPTLWKAVHNREHHNKTNSLKDPDRNYLYQQPKTWGKWIQNLFVPSSEVNPFWLTVGMTSAWGVHTFRNLTSVLLFNNESVDYVQAAFTVNSKERRAIAGEFLIILMLHLSILAYLEFNPIKLVLSYFLPIGIGYAGIIFYVYTNHMLSRMTSVNDPLINSLSIRVPKIFDLLHLNFSYHTEHHIFPGINSDYYPLVQELLKIHYSDRFNLLDAGEAWRLMLQTPRHYKDENTFTDWDGEKDITFPLGRSISE